DHAEALQLADAWLPTAPGPVQSAIQSLWVDQAKAALAKKDFASVRTSVKRLEAHFADSPSIDEARKRLHDRALALQKEAQEMPDSAAIRALEEALMLWPRLPNARDALARRQGTFRTLIVGLRSLPKHLSPAT